MAWLKLITYFTVWAVVLIMAIEIYSWLLRRAARLPAPAPLILGLISYVAVAGTYALPLLGLELIQGSQPDETLRLVNLSLYLACILIPTWYFRRRHLDTLKAMGYFRSAT